MEEQMNNPMVSIGLPVFNGERFIERALVSLLNQDIDDIEIIISDNASDDETEVICRQYARNDKRIQYSRNRANVGAAGNYNKVFQLAKGKYFKWAAHDDECYRTMLRRCVEVLEEAPESVVMVYPQAELIDEEGRTLETGSDRIGFSDPRPHRRLAKILWSLNLCDPVFGLIKAEVLRRTGLIGPFFGADNVLLSELAMLGEIRELDEVLFRMRMHRGRSMKANPSHRARAAWYDPTAAQKVFILPSWERMVWEMLRAVSRAPLSSAEKLRCGLVVTTVHYWRRFKNAGGRLKGRVRDVVGGQPADQVKQQLGRRGS
ncbi:MAG: glycosyltransferase family 2 protein [Nitrospirota bacterium]